MDQVPLHSPPLSRDRAPVVTLADVAKVAGVSTITASRALANPGIVTQKTRDKVLEAMRITGYTQNFVASSFKSNRTRLIACLVPTIASGSTFMPAVQAMTKAFAEAGYQVLLGERGYDPAHEEALIEASIARRPDGIVITGILQTQEARDKLIRSGIPVLEAWDMTDQPIDMLVGFSHSEAGKSVAHYLHGKGRRNVAVIASTEPRGAARARGFIEAAQQLGITGPEGTVPTFTCGAPTRLVHGRDGLTQLLRDHPEIDAICCSTDLVALGTLIEARSRGIAIPDQLAVVGFGDLDFAADTDPPLTTVRVDSCAIGHQAAASLIERIRGVGPSQPIQDFGFSLCERGST